MDTNGTLNKSESYFRRATNPTQYDNGEVEWMKEGLKESPVRKFFHEYLRPNLEVKSKNVLDIGSGTGPLFPLLKEAGAMRVIGIEPSSQNVAASRTLYPDFEVFNEPFEYAGLQGQVDVAVAVMVFEHIADLGSAFAKIRNLLPVRGHFYLIAGDKEYFSTPRFDREISVENIDESTVAVRTESPMGTLYDVVRAPGLYIECANENGLLLKKHVELKPTEDLLKAEPKFAEHAKRTIAHLFVFQKQD